MQLTEHFSLEELTASEAALRLGLDNTPGPHTLNNLRRLAEAMEHVRHLLGGHAVVVSSAFRSTSVNLAIGGSGSSAHIQGLAADFVCPGYGTPLDICRQIEAAGVPFDQLIYEGRWVHLAIPKESASPRREVLTAHFEHGRVRYTRGLP